MVFFPTFCCCWLHFCFSIIPHFSCSVGETALFICLFILTYLFIYLLTSSWPNLYRHARAVLTMLAMKPSPAAFCFAIRIHNVCTPLLFLGWGTFISLSLLVTSCLCSYWPHVWCLSCLLREAYEALIYLSLVFFVFLNLCVYVGEHKQQLRFLFNSHFQSLKKKSLWAILFTDHSSPWSSALAIL